LELNPLFAPSQLDDLLAVHGQVCTQPPDDAVFPVKIMFIVDSSGSLQQTDEMDHRVEAVRQVVRRFAGNPNVYFDIIKFNGVVSDLSLGFTNTLTGNEDTVFGSAGILQATSMTDYQGALGKAYEVLLNDMRAGADRDGGLAELSRTKYVVIFFSDGTPDPVCFGCSEDPTSPRYSVDCEEDFHVMCQTMDSSGNPVALNMEEVLAQHEADNLFAGLEDGADYNQNYQIFQLVDSIMELKRTFHVGEMRMHSAFLYCRDQYGNPTSAQCENAERQYHLDPDRGRALLREMSRRGSGTFRDFTSGQDINFLTIDYTSIKRSYSAKNMLVTNLNAFPGSSEFLPDSDGDGLDDDTELRLGSNPLNKDSDLDGYQDAIEVKLANGGFDLLDESKPGLCQDLVDNGMDDIDGDGLRLCEEALFGTNDNYVDTDSDGFPDLYEVLYGLDALSNDLAEDLDSDGQRNSDELLFHSHPGRSDPMLWEDHRYWYEMRPGEVGADDQQCYNFDIRYVTLVTTKNRGGNDGQGYNDVLIWFDQASNDDPQDPGRFRVACVRAQYIAPDYKVPFKGEITITDKDFVSPVNLDLSYPGGSCVTASE
jgi:hypothetical protein